MNRRSKFNKVFKKRPFEEKVPKHTMQVLKRAWNDLPPDFTINERLMFVELAERIIKLSSGRSEN